MLSDLYIVQLYQKLKTSSGASPDGGNCGQSAYAIYRFLRDNELSKDYHVGCITNVNNMDELIHGEPDVYHMFLVKDRHGNKRYYDSTGKIDVGYLGRLSRDQYNDSSPFMFIFELPDEEKELLSVISQQTNYNVDWNYFYDLLKK